MEQQPETQTDGTTTQQRIEQLTEWQTEILRLERSADAAQQEMEAARATLKIAKADYESTVDELRAAIRDNSTGQLRLPFSLDGSTVIERITIAGWGNVPITDLIPYGVTEKICENIAAALQQQSRPTTIRGLRDWIAASEFWYRDIKGVGPAKIDKITDSLVNYQADNPEAVEEQENAAEPEHGAANPTGTIRCGCCNADIKADNVVSCPLCDRGGLCSRCADDCDKHECSKFVDDDDDEEDDSEEEDVDEEI